VKKKTKPSAAQRRTGRGLDERMGRSRDVPHPSRRRGELAARADIVIGAKKFPRVPGTNGSWPTHDHAPRRPLILYLYDDLADLDDPPPVFGQYPRGLIAKLLPWLRCERRRHRAQTARGHRQHRGGSVRDDTRIPTDACCHHRRAGAKGRGVMPRYVQGPIRCGCDPVCADPIACFVSKCAAAAAAVAAPSRTPDRAALRALPRLEVVRGGDIVPVGQDHLTIARCGDPAHAALIVAAVNAAEALLDEVEAAERDLKIVHADFAGERGRTRDLKDRAERAEARVAELEQRHVFHLALLATAARNEVTLRADLARANEEIERLGATTVPIEEIPEAALDEIAVNRHRKARGGAE
jgi:hypothetical protein